MLPIRCEHCNRWLLRIEDGYVYVVCPRCRHEIPLKITELILQLDLLIQSLMAAVNGDEIVYGDKPVETRPRKDKPRPKPFG